jgi:hypothetical protein
MAAAPNVAVAPLVMRGTTRQLILPSCLLKPNDLRRIYRLLEPKALEAAERQVAALALQPGQTQAQLDELKAMVRDALVLVIKLQTGSEWINGTTVDLLNDEQLPDGLVKVEFDSAFLYRSRFNNLVPNNSFNVTIDLVRPGILDFSNPPAENTSAVSILGLDATWANAVYDELTAFFRQRGTRRSWLHSRRSYDSLVIPIGFPLSFDIVYHLDRLIRRVAMLPEALSIASYVYAVLLVLFGFRILFNYARWAFPKLEIDAPRQHVAVGHRVAISTLALIVLGALVKAALRLVGIG